MNRREPAGENKPSIGSKPTWLTGPTGSNRCTRDQGPASCKLSSAWTQDPDLAGIRAEEAVNQLAEDERKACQILWKEVDQILAEPAKGPNGSKASSNTIGMKFTPILPGELVKQSFFFMTGLRPNWPFSSETVTRPVSGDRPMDAPVALHPTTRPCVRSAWASSTTRRRRRSTSIWSSAQSVGNGSPSCPRTASWKASATHSEPSIRRSASREPGGPQSLTDKDKPAHASGRTRCRRVWPIIPTTRSFASWAAAAWAWSSWPRTSSWGARRCSRSSAVSSSTARGARPLPARDPGRRQAAPP